MPIAFDVWPITLAPEPQLEVADPITTMDLTPAEASLVRQHRAARENADPGISTLVSSKWTVTGTAIHLVQHWSDGKVQESWFNEDCLRRYILASANALSALVEAKYHAEYGGDTEDEGVYRLEIPLSPSAPVADTERPPPPTGNDKPISEWAVFSGSVRRTIRFESSEEVELWYSAEELRAEMQEMRDALEDLENVPEECGPGSPCCLPECSQCTASSAEWGSE